MTDQDVNVDALQFWSLWLPLMSGEDAIEEHISAFELARPFVEQDQHNINRSERRPTTEVGQELALSYAIYAHCSLWQCDPDNAWRSGFT